MFSGLLCSLAATATAAAAAAGGGGGGAASAHAASLPELHRNHICAGIFAVLPGCLAAWSRGRLAAWLPAGCLAYYYYHITS